MALQIKNICKSFGTDIILENININVADGEKAGLIGVNGAGKTTLLKIIAGESEYDSGSVMKSKDSRVGFLHQTDDVLENKTIWQTMVDVFSDIVELEKDIRALEIKMSDLSADSEQHNQIMKSYAVKSEQFDKAGGFKMRAQIMGVLNGMGFDGFDLNTYVMNLSGGERTKLKMAKLLLEAPEILLLDEPTNHLDFKTMQWLESYLKSYKGTVITVSHDRYFLDKTVTCIYEIERTKCTKYTCNYSGYIDMKKQNAQTEQKHYEIQQKEIKRLAEYVERNGVRASTAKSAKSKQKMIDRMEIIEKPDLELKACKFSFEMEYPSYKDVLNVDNLELRVEKSGKPTAIANNITFDVKRGEKAAIIGANGVGKTTLLKTLLNINKNYGGEFEFGRNVEISYYDQEQTMLDNSKTVIDELWDRLPSLDETQIRTLLGTMLFTDDDVYKPVSNLSGGERARLMFLALMSKKANTMVLDEPTNHLDLPSKEVLDNAVKMFDGTVIMVSHDRYFLNKTADKIIELTPNGVKVYNGNYDYYLNKIAEETDNTVTDTNRAKKSAVDYETAKRKNAEIKSKTKKVQKTEADINEFEKKIELLNAELEQSGSDYEKAKKLYTEIEETENQLNELYEAWNNLSEELDKLNNE